MDIRLAAIGLLNARTAGLALVVGNELGRTMHVVVDELNLEREHIESCRRDALEIGNTRGAALAERLLAVEAIIEKHGASIALSATEVRAGTGKHGWAIVFKGSRHRHPL